MSTPESANLDRKAASRLLKVSIRTLDRYIKDKKLSTRQINGRIWLDKKEIKDFIGRQSRQAEVDRVDMSIDDLSIDNRVDNVDKTVGKDDKVELVDFEVSSEGKTRNGKFRVDKVDIYKKLYEDLRGEVMEKQARLEIANYRVGQLEAQVKNSIPLLEYHQESYERKKKEEELKNELSNTASLVEKLMLKLKYLQFSKKIFLIVLLIVLSLQPLWLLLLYGE